jgi:putative ABC transport system substrate-binding protein
MNVNIRFWQTGTESDLQAALESAGRVPLDALFVTAGVIHGLPEIRSRIARFALQRRLLTVSDTAGAFFLDGGVLAYAADPKELGARAAYYVDRILRGANPGDLPIEQPTRYLLTVSLKRAKALGLTIPPSLLLRADQVIE